MKPLSFKIPKAGSDTIFFQEDHSERFYPHLHLHPEVQFTYIQSGRGTLVCGAYIGEFREGDFYIIGPDVPHLFRSDDSSVASIAVSAFAEAGFLGATYFGQGDHMRGQRFLQESLEGIKIKVGVEVLGGELIAMGKLRGIERFLAFGRIVERASRDGSYELLNGGMPRVLRREKDSKRMEDLYRWMLDHYQERITLSQAADRCNMSRSAFCRYFRQHTRRSFVELLNEMRIRHASRLLLESEETVITICYLSGFNNLSLFNRKFRQYRGVAPKEYRNSKRRKDHG